MYVSVAQVCTPILHYTVDDMLSLQLIMEELITIRTETCITVINAVKIPYINVLKIPQING